MRRVGIEIEVESDHVTVNEVHSSISDSNLWVLDMNEGSLRAGEFGWEVKTAGNGLPLNQALNSLNMMYPLLRGSTGSWRAAVHCHVDVSDLPLWKLAVVLGLSYAVDDSLFEEFSPERKESNFCVPLGRKAPSVLSTLDEYLSNVWETSFGKYSSVNFRNYERLGTVEFRHMRTPECGTDVEDIKSCIDRIGSFVKTSHDVVQHAATACFHKKAALPAFMLAIQNASTLPLGVAISMEAALDVINRMEAAVSLDISEADIGSVAKVASGKTETRTHRYTQQAGDRPYIPDTAEVQRTIAEARAWTEELERRRRMGEVALSILDEDENTEDT